MSKPAGGEHCKCTTCLAWLSVERLSLGFGFVGQWRMRLKVLVAIWDQLGLNAGFREELNLGEFLVNPALRFGHLGSGL